MVSLSPAMTLGVPFSCFGDTRLAEGRPLKGEATLPVEDGRRSVAGGSSRSGGRRPGGCSGKAMGKPAMYSTLPTLLATCGEKGAKRGEKRQKWSAETHKSCILRQQTQVLCSRQNPGIIDWFGLEGSLRSSSSFYLT